MRARFLVNLRPLTIDPAFSGPLRPPGYLAAPAYLTRSTRTFALERGRGRSLLVDNGLFDDVGRLATAFSGDAATVLDATGSDPIRGRLSPPVLATADDLLERLAAATDQTTPPLDLGQQLSLLPNAVVGVEDIWAATLLRLGINLSLVRDGRSTLKRRNTAVAARVPAALTAAGAAGPDPGSLSVPASGRTGSKHRTVYYLPVASALDYDTAFDAGRVFSASGVSGVALGFGAFMADDSYTDRVKRNGRYRRLARRVPRRYLQTALVAQGFWDGWAADTREQAPQRFHFLGLGAPIMVGLAALAGFATPQLTFDATSPIRDATEGTLYFNDPAPLKIRTRVLAARLADDPDYTWPCNCPFCRSYLALHPFDRDAAVRWRITHPDRPIEADDLRASNPLGQALPLLSEPRGGPMRKELDLARIGHNHWSLQRVITEVNAHASSRDTLAAHEERVVATYESTTNSNAFATAVRMAYEIITST